MKATSTCLAALAVSILNPLSIAQAAGRESRDGGTTPLSGVVSPVGVSRDATTPPGGTGQEPSREKTATAPVAVTAGPMLEGSAKTFHPPRAWKIPLGHPDFYPSDERPIGWRGDRTGAWPGANCVNTWNAETGENIVWKVNTPGAGFSQPIVVGEKVFITADPNLLVCYSVHDGTELWRTAIDHTSVMDPETREKARAEIKFFDAKQLEFSRWADGCDALAKVVAAKGVSTQSGGVGEKVKQHAFDTLSGWIRLACRRVGMCKGP